MPDLAAAERRVEAFMRDMHAWETGTAPSPPEFSCDDIQSVDDLVPFFRTHFSLPGEAEWKEIRRVRDVICRRHCVGDHWYHDNVSYGGRPEHGPENEAIFGSELIEDGRAEVFAECDKYGRAEIRVYMLEPHGEDWRIREYFDLEPPGLRKPQDDEMDHRPLPTTLATPAAPVQIERLLPAMSGFARNAVRLHPRRDGSIGARASKMGGTFLHNDPTHWPRCYNHNTPLAGVLQLFKKDVPELGYPPGKDVFQLFWCPIDFYKMVQVRWLSLDEAVDPEGPNPEVRRTDDCSIPKPCRVFPERVSEYPDSQDLTPDIVEKIESCKAIREVGRLYWPDEDTPAIDVYNWVLSAAPGTKVGGYPRWIQFTETPRCSCGANMEYVLTVDSGEPGDRWTPIEEADGQRDKGPGLILGDLGSLYLFICRACEAWPVKAVAQCS